MSEDFTNEERATIQRLIESRRDVRKFDSRPIPDDVIARILMSAHAAPSVGLMQPWNFILIESLEIRRQIRASFDAVNDREKLKLQGTERGELYGSLKLEGILEAPLNIAVTCDPSRTTEYVLGRDPMPQTAPYSVCLAIQNLWLSARAEGVGVGWVSILDQVTIRRTLKIPQKVELVAYLCVGYPTEFRSRPMLEEVGWKERTPLKQLVFKNEWGVVPAETDC